MQQLAELAQMLTFQAPLVLLPPPGQLTPTMISYLIGLGRIYAIQGDVTYDGRAVVILRGSLHSNRRACPRRGSEKNPVPSPAIRSAACGIRDFAGRRMGTAVSSARWFELVKDGWIERALLTIAGRVEFGSAAGHASGELAQAAEAPDGLAGSHLVCQATRTRRDQHHADHICSR